MNDKKKERLRNQRRERNLEKEYYRKPTPGHFINVN